MANASHEIEPGSSLPAKNKNETLYLWKQYLLYKWCKLIVFANLI